MSPETLMIRGPPLECRQAISDNVGLGGTWKSGLASHQEGTSRFAETLPSYHSPTNPRRPTDMMNKEIGYAGSSLVSLHFVPWQPAWLSSSTIQQMQVLCLCSVLSHAFQIHPIEKPPFHPDIGSVLPSNVHRRLQAWAG